MNELKPCPFCGRKKLEVHSERTVFIMCSSCETRGNYYDTEAEAIEAWNTRANDMTDEQRSHLTRLAEEMVDVLTLSGGGYLNEYGG